MATYGRPSFGPGVVDGDDVWMAEARHGLRLSQEPLLGVGALHLVVEHLESDRAVQGWDRMAEYTVPMPPLPIRSTILYRPNSIPRMSDAIEAVLWLPKESAGSRES